MCDEKLIYLLNLDMIRLERRLIDMLNRLRCKVHERGCAQLRASLTQTPIQKVYAFANLTVIIISFLYHKLCLLNSKQNGNINDEKFFYQ